METQSHLLTVITFLPLLSVAALLFLRSQDRVWVRRIALAASLAEFVVSLLLLPGFQSGTSQFQFEEFYSWIGAANIHYHVGVDGISLFLVLLTTFLTPIAILCSWNSIQENVKGFFISLLVIETAMIGVFVSLDLFLFFVYWELTLIPMYFLIGIWGHDRKIYAAIKFILYTMFGSILMLVAILWLYNLTGSFDLAGYGNIAGIQQFLARNALPPHTELWLFGAFFLAFAIKVPVFPLHTWLPDAHTDAPTAGSVILAGVMLKLGTYGMLRFCLPLFPDASHRLAPIIGVLAIIGIVYGALVALAQKDWKRLVAYSSVSHMAMVMLGMFALNPVGITGSIVQQLNHGISTGALFLLVGVVYERRHTREISEYGGLSKVMPVYAAIFLIMTMSSIGLPALNGFIGEFLILQGVFVANKVWAAFAASGVVLGAAYMLYLYQRTMFGKIENPKNERLADLSHREFATFAPLIVLAVWIGLYPKPFLDRLDKSVEHIVNRVSSTYTAKYAECDTTVTPEKVAASDNPLMKFASAAQCDANGNPLPEKK